MFGASPPPWLQQRIYPATPAERIEVTNWIPSAGMSFEEFSRRELVPHP
jgi:hypothetical protein